MTDIPGYCTHCGTLFTRGDIFALDDSTNITLQRTQTNCPKCKKLAYLVEGIFDFSGGKIIVRDAPLGSIILIAAIIAGRQLQDGRLDREELFAPLNYLPDQLKNLFLNSFLIGGLRGYIGALLAALTIAIASTHTTATLDWNILFDQIHVAVTHSAPYPGLTHGQVTLDKPVSKVDQPTATAPNEEPKSEPAQSKRQQRRQRGRTKMQRKQPNRSTSPKKKC